MNIRSVLALPAPGLITFPHNSRQSRQLLFISFSILTRDFAAVRDSLKLPTAEAGVPGEAAQVPRFFLAFRTVEQHPLGSDFPELASRCSLWSATSGGFPGRRPPPEIKAS